jgi:acyl-CoA thioesterase I
VEARPGEDLVIGARGVVVGLALLAAVAAAASPAAPATPAAPPARAKAQPPDRRTLVPAPLVSRGRPVASHPGGGQVVVDGVYRTSLSWAGGRPTPAHPSWVAIDVGRGPTRLLVSWTSSGNHDYLDRKYGAPVDYRIETSADSTDGANGTWRTVATVTGNPVRSRAHAVDFAGQRWIRMVVTGLSPDVFEYGLFLDEVDVHDLSRGGDDVWVFLGDSITSSVFDRAPAHQPSFAESIARLHPGYYPAVVGAGYGSLHHADAVRRIDEVLALNPDAKVVALAFGSNDWDPEAFRRDLLEVIRKVRAAGRIPVVARIPFRADSPVDYPARLNAVVDEVTARLGLVPGPDPYPWFRDHRSSLVDGLHPDDAGAREMIRRWAEAVAPLYP